MLKYPWYSLSVLLALRSASAIPTGAPLSFREPWKPEGNASMAQPLFERDDDIFDASDLSFIKKIAAIGDSYSAGIGAGNKLGSIFDFDIPDSDFACSRYDHAYPYLVHSDDRLGGADQHSFQFLSCSGAVTADVINKQIPKLDPMQDVILVSAGGNDALLTDILNQCIFQWAVASKTQALVAKVQAQAEGWGWVDDFDWEKISHGCEGQLEISRDIINSGTFSNNLDAVLAGAKAKLSSTGMVYLTGYAKFWDEAYSSECDSVTWTMWFYKAWSSLPAERLTVAHRRTMNVLVDLVNAKLSAAADRAGPQVKFVNYDKYVGEFSGRFCAPGVDESSSESNTRTGLMFYEFKTKDIFNALPWKRSEVSVVEDTFSGSQNILAQIMLLMYPNATYAPQDGATAPTDPALDLASEAKIAITSDIPPTSDLLGLVPNLLPDGWGRVFHPQVLLHYIIANLVIYEMVNHRQESNGYGSIPEVLEFDSCPLIPEIENPDDGSGSGGQQIALASYINPLGDPASWERIFAYDTDKVSVLVANVLNGPDYVVDTAWKSVIDRAASQGKKILGYVRTGYLGVSQQKFTTRLGSHDLADWASQIEQDVDKWFELYGTNLGGIFFDEGWPECGPNNIYADLYAYINDYTKHKHPGAFTVLNPGSPIAQCYENTMDTLLTFESSYESYTNSFVPNDWTPKDPRKIWHIIYKVPQDQIANVAALARSRHSGLLEITDDDQPNPYDNLPNEAYMQAAIGAIPGGKPRIDAPAKLTGSHVAGLPNNAVVSSSDYSSVTLTWSSVADALGYAVYKNGEQVLELPASLTRATVGMLDPGSSGITFEIRTILASGSGGSSRLISASTKSLPANGTIANVGFTQNGDTVTYKADVLVPYAFVRLFIGINQPSIGVGRGWPIDTPDPKGFATHEIVNYLVEGNDFYSGFYKYSGAWYEGTKANADWSWTSIGVAPQSQNGYTYTWNVPFAGTDAVASEYIIQGQGYAPYKNVFMGTLRSYTSLF